MFARNYFQEYYRRSEDFSKLYNPKVTTSDNVPEKSGICLVFLKRKAQDL
jgi:hypothetical protein